MWPLWEATAAPRLQVYSIRLAGLRDYRNISGSPCLQLATVQQTLDQERRVPISRWVRSTARAGQLNSAGTPSLAWIAFASRGPMPRAVPSEARYSASFWLSRSMPMTEIA